MTTPIRKLTPEERKAIFDSPLVLFGAKQPTSSPKKSESQPKQDPKK
jgi:hypothetical protein